MQMNGSSRRRAGSDSHLNLAKTFLFARTSLSHHKSSVSPHSTTEASSKPQQFVYKGDSKLHTFDSKEAPWPYSFNREVLELCGIDHALVMWAKGHQMFADFHGNPPRRCLDLGTAMGDWVINTASHLPNCTFVGFDLVNIQIPLEYVPPSIAERIEWMHGNFLQAPLPFKDNEFDYIHIEGVALGVPENKWDQLFEELNRILQPGGHIEIIQQDARFPVLPRWFTEPLHAHVRQFGDGSTDGSHSPYPPSLVSEDLPHAFALLEELFLSVFESRLINPTPTSILPAYFNTSFRQVVSPPVLHFPMPPLAPLAPFPKWAVQPPSGEVMTTDPLDIDQYFVPVSEDNSTHREITPLTIDTNVVRDTTYSTLSSPTDSQSRPTSPTSTTSPTQRASSISSADRARRLRRDSSIPSSPNAHRSSSAKSTRARSAVVLTTNTTTRLGGENTGDLFKIDKLMRLGNETLFMHLYIATQMVLGTKEAMWEELYKRIDARDVGLRKYGWGADDYGERESRERFDTLVSRYEQDMHIRLSLWNSLVKSGWSYPRRGHMTQAELHQEEDLRRAILEARKNAKEEDFSTPSRSIRLLIGVKSV